MEIAFSNGNRNFRTQEVTRFAQCTNIAEYSLAKHAVGSLIMCYFMGKENLFNVTAEGCQMLQHKAP